MRTNIDELALMFRDEYVRGPGVIGAHAILNMWQDFASNAYDEEVIKDVTREDISRVLLKLTAEVVAMGLTDKMQTSHGEWVDLTSIG